MANIINIIRRSQPDQRINIIKIFFRSILKWFRKKEPEETFVPHIEPEESISPLPIDKIILRKKLRRGILYEYKGKNKTLSEWSRLYGIKYQTLYSRIRIFDGDFAKILESSIGYRPIRRSDIKTEDLVYMYEVMKLTIQEIQEETGFTNVYKRLLKAGVKFRSPKNRVKSISEIEDSVIVERTE